MKINIAEIDLGSFMVHPHVVNGDVLHLVQPNHIGCSWTQANKHFRSSLWDDEGNLVSAGFPKFTNWGEKPEHFPVPTSLKGTTVVEKLDGSLLIVSKYKGHYILRTRGTSDATKLDNGAELEIFRQDYLPRLVAFIENDCGKIQDTWEVSYLFEWTSPFQKIVINYGEQPEWYLVGAIGHTDYSLASQDMLDGLAQAASFKRPVTYTFPSVEELLANVELWKGKEGICIYSKDGQCIHKVKALEYLAKHRFKSEATLENTLDLYFSMDKPEYQDFEKKLSEAFDYECFEMVRGYVSVICDAAKEVSKIVEAMHGFVAMRLKSLPTRKEQALVVISSYGGEANNRASMVFKLLDNRALTNDDLKKLFWQVLKKT